MEEEITRKTLWRSVHGEVEALEDIEDTHLMNLQSYISSDIRFKHNPNKGRLLKVIGELIKERGLNPTGESEPYTKDGNWYYYNQNERRHIQIVGAVKSSKKVCKKCRSGNTQEWQRPWSSVDEKIWNDKGYVLCYLRSGEIALDKEIALPSNCPYKLEHIVLGGKNE